MATEGSDRRSSAFAAETVAENYAQRLAPVIFEPWAMLLVEAVGVEDGDQVLDVASGTGAVAREAARRAGPSGRVVASDVSAGMLERAGLHSPPAGAAAIEYVEAPAEALPLPDGAVDVVLCQHGLPFFGDRSAAVREMRRVIRPGGVAGVAVWAAGYRLEPFDDYVEALAAAGVEPPFPRAFENESFKMEPDELQALFEAAGFESVKLSIVNRTIAWPDPVSAATGIFGTPFGPIVAGLAPDARRELDAGLARRFAATSPGDAVRRTTTSVLARAVAPIA